MNLKLEKAAERERRREERRRAAIENDEEEDEEDEEEEEEEEEELDEEAARERDRRLEEKLNSHGLVQGAQALQFECSGKVNALVQRAGPDLDQACRAALISFFDSAEDLAARCRAEAGIALDAALPALPAAHVDHEAETAWQHILSTAPIEEPAQDPKSGKKTAAKKDKEMPKLKRGMTVSKIDTPSENQILHYRRALYSGLCNGLLDALVNGMFNNVHISMQAPERTVVQTEQLVTAASLRPVDLLDDVTGGAAVFVNFDGDAFVYNDVMSAYDAVGRRRRAAIQPVVEAVRYGAQLVVLLYEDVRRLSSGEAESKAWSLLEKSYLVSAALEDAYSIHSAEVEKLRRHRKKGEDRKSVV